MRVNMRTVMRARGAFGAGIAVLGLVITIRVVLAAGPLGTKVPGLALGVVMLGLGITRIVQYQQWRRSQPQ
ncbi:MAG: hypothetical protein ABR975_06030 [Vulcanimicrobiaceae bacterium]|jgi:hypothetical protein